MRKELTLFEPTSEAKQLSSVSEDRQCDISGPSIPVQISSKCVPSGELT